MKNSGITKFVFFKILYRASRVDRELEWIFEAVYYIITLRISSEFMYLRQSA